ITSADHESHGISRGHTADITLYRDTIYHYPGGVIRVHAADLHSDKSTILDTPADHIVESHTVTAVKIGIGMLSVTLNGNISKKNIVIVDQEAIERNCVAGRCRVKLGEHSLARSSTMDVDASS